MSIQETATVLNPSRPQVLNIVMWTLAIQDPEEDSAQMFADLLMATAQVAYMANVEVDGIEDMFRTAMPNAKIAGDFLLAEMKETSDG